MVTVSNDVIGIGGSSFPNGTLVSTSAGFISAVEFWVLVFRVCRSSSASAGDSVDFVESARGVKVASGY